MLRVSYSVLIVDEYQDCQPHQHALVTAVSQTLPTCVFGDRMQGLFFFNSLRAVNWEADVASTFPALSVPIRPWRWEGKNGALGEWLLVVRDALLNGLDVDLAQTPVTVVSENDAVRACSDLPGHPETCVAIARWPNSAALLARKLGGRYTMIEELEGRFLRDFAQIVDNEAPAAIAAATAGFAIQCAFGVADVLPIDQRRRLAQDKPLSLTDCNTPDVHGALNRILVDPRPCVVLEALLAIRCNVTRFSLYRREAWFGILDALRLADANADTTVLRGVVQLRHKISLLGRRPESRIVGRPLLIKGLEFDHAVLTEVERLNAHELYVALSRGARSVTVVTSSLVLRAERPSGS
jgi:hypothetical protein